MAEPDTFLLRITDGTTTLDLNDHLSYSLDEGMEWQPALAPDEYAEQVIEALSINVLGAKEIGGENYGSITLRNCDALRSMLRQAYRAVDDAEVEPIILYYCPQHHGPKAIYKAVVLDWLNPQMSAGINSAAQLGANQTIEKLPIEIIRRHPWKPTYINDNLQLESRWRTDPAWTHAGAGVRSFQSVVTPYGALGAQTITFAGAGSATLTAPASQNELVLSSTDPFTVMVRVAATQSGDITCVLRNSGNSADVSNTIGTQAITVGETIDHPEAQWLCFNATASTSIGANARLRFTIDADGVGAITIAEVLVLEGTHAVDDDRWHMASVDLETPDSATSVTVPTVSTFTTETLTDSPTPCTLYVAFNGTGAHANAFRSGVTILNSGNIDLYALSTSTATTYTSVADANLAYPSGNVLRHTPVAAATWAYTAAITLTNPSRHLAVLLVARNNSASHTYTVKYQGLLQGEFSTHESRPIAIGPYSGSASPQVYHLGEIHHHRPFIKIKLAMQASATGSTLDGNRIIVVDLSDDTKIISHLDLYSITMPDRLELNANWLEASEPQYDIYSSGIVFQDIVPTIDNLRARIRGQTVRVLIDGVSNGKWRYTADGTNAETHTTTLVRDVVAEFPR